MDRVGQVNKMTVVHLQGSEVEKKMYAMLQGKVDMHTKLFDLYRNKMFEIISGDTTVSFSEFEIPRSTMMNTLVLKPGVDPNLIDPEDPTNYIDTWFVIKPREFDFLGFEKRNNQIYFEIFDKNPVLSLSPGKTSEPKYIRTKYKIPFTAAIKYLHPTEIEAIQYLFK
jgi:hypothetical protein